jgi:hypothetical protein
VICISGSLAGLSVSMVNSLMTGASSSGGVQTRIKSKDKIMIDMIILFLIVNSILLKDLLVCFAS